MPTTAATARPYLRLTAAPSTGPTVQANAKPNTTTTAATGLRSFPAVRRTQPAPTSPTALPKFRAGAATAGTLRKAAAALPTIPAPDTNRKAVVQTNITTRKSAPKTAAISNVLRPAARALSMTIRPIRLTKETPAAWLSLPRAALISHTAVQFIQTSIFRSIPNAQPCQSQP